MTRGELVEEIRNKLGYNTGLEEVLIEDAIDNAQRELEHMPSLPFFLRTRNYEMLIDEDVEEVPLPEDLLRFLNFPAIYYRANDSERFRALKNISYEELARLRQFSFDDFRRSGRYNYSLLYDDEDYPLYSSIDGDTLYLYPRTNNPLTLQLHYYKRDVLLDAEGAENKWSKQAPYLLIGKAGVLLSGNNRDKEGLQVFGQMFQVALSELRNRSVARNVAGQSMQRGGDD